MNILIEAKIGSLKANHRGETTLNINITRITQSKINNVDMINLNFGEVFSDHMLIVDYANGRWQVP